MDWAATLDLYCERTDPGFWAEPLNAVSNAAFLVAAVAAVMNAPPDARRDPLPMALAAIVFAIGLGSFAFHTLATRGAMLFDVGPISLFIHLYLYAGMRRFVGFNPALSAALTLAFFAAGFSVDRIGEGALNGSVGYLPALGAMPALAAGTWLQGTVGARRTGAAKRLLTIAALFALSITFRSIDNAICPAFPSGTHFLWHTLNACVLFLLLRLLFQTGKPVRTA
jgi:hypothetical protein